MKPAPGVGGRPDRRGVGRRCRRGVAAGQLYSAALGAGAQVSDTMAGARCTAATPASCRWHSSEPVSATSPRAAPPRRSCWPTCCTPGPRHPPDRFGRTGSVPCRRGEAPGRLLRARATALGLGGGALIAAGPVPTSWLPEAATAPTVACIRRSPSCGSCWAASTAERRQQLAAWILLTSAWSTGSVDSAGPSHLPVSMSGLCAMAVEIPCRWRSPPNCRCGRRGRLGARRDQPGRGRGGLAVFTGAGSGLLGSAGAGVQRVVAGVGLGESQVAQRTGDLRCRRPGRWR